MFKKKILSRFMIIYIIIVSIYTLLVTSILAYKSSQISYIENDYINKIFVEQVSDNLDYKIDMGIKFIDNVSTLPSIISYLNNEKIDYVNSTYIYNNLSENLKTFEQLGFSIGVTKISDDFVITPKATYQYDNFLNSINIKNEYLKNLNTIFINKDNKNQYYIVPEYMHQANSDFLTIIRRVNYYNDPHTNLFYFLSFDTSTLLPTDLPRSEGNFSLITDEVISTTSNSINNLLPQLKQHFKNNNIVIIKNKKNNKDLNYVLNSKILPEIKYTYTINKAYLRSNFTIIVKNILLFNAFLLLLGITIIYKATNRTYEPIKNLLAIFENIDSKTPIDELAFIKENIENINKHNKNLENTLNSSLVEMKTSFFRNILYGFINNDLIHESIEQYKLEVFLDGGVICILDFEGISDIENTFSENKIAALRLSIFTKFNDDSFFVLSLNHKRYCLIFNNTNNESIVCKLESMIEKIESEFSLDIVSSVSNSVASIHELQSAFQEALKLIEFKYSIPNEKIITLKSIEDIPQDTYVYPIEIENCLIQYITYGDKAKTLDLLTTILDKNLIEATLSARNLINFRYAITNTTKRVLNEYDKTLRSFTANNDALFVTFNEATDEVLKNCIINIFDKLFDECITDPINLSNPIVANILVYIQQNYDKDISLTNISDKFNLSEGYISKLLKSTLDTSFKPYINGLKIKKAKELLAKGTYKVNEVGKAVGCENPNTFIRIFKKHEGISPGEYIKALSSLNTKQ